MEEKIINALRELGFTPQHPENGESWMFNYEGSRYFYMPNDNEHLLNIVIPYVVDHEDFPNADYASIAQKVNAELCFIKAYVQYDNLWITYEQYIFGDEDNEHIKEILARMIQFLDQGKDYARSLAASTQSSNESGSSSAGIEFNDNNGNGNKEEES